MRKGRLVYVTHTHRRLSSFELIFIPTFCPPLILCSSFQNQTNQSVFQSFTFYLIPERVTVCRKPAMSSICCRKLYNAVHRNVRVCVSERFSAPQKCYSSQIQHKRSVFLVLAPASSLKHCLHHHLPQFRKMYDDSDVACVTKYGRIHKRPYPPTHSLTHTVNAEEEYPKN